MNNYKSHYFTLLSVDVFIHNDVIEFVPTNVQLKLTYRSIWNIDGMYLLLCICALRKEFFWNLLKGQNSIKCLLMLKFDGYFNLLVLFSIMDGETDYKINKFKHIDIVSIWTHARVSIANYFTVIIALVHYTIITYFV